MRLIIPIFDNPTMESSVEPNADQDAEYWITRGDASFKEGNYGDAIEWYKKALEIDPRSTRTWNNLRDAYLKTGDTENARACCHAIQSLHEDTEVQPEKRGDMGQLHSFIRFFISTLVHLLISPKKTMKSLTPTGVTTAVWSSWGDISSSLFFFPRKILNS